ncbi:hypothetical protein H6F77_23175 [Microcoleus sp. FACHB-831]|uniref:hypothetical protein n=1 Tax=Microcoleus sp. FACHB-831 TaxID=2692827 RepID=UPI0016843BAE|nr:hypothetical protein [Microcoleus sp. FACHB-831]MBD1923947.1 hypothetical protein [Microcoleus sp. FACHB-831]
MSRRAIAFHTSTNAQEGRQEAGKEFKLLRNAYHRASGIHRRHGGGISASALRLRSLYTSYSSFTLLNTVDLRSRVFSHLQANYLACKSSLLRYAE